MEEALVRAGLGRIRSTHPVGGGCINETLKRIEELSSEITELNQKIRQAEMLNQSPNDLKDKRDSLLNNLAQLIDVELEPIRNTGGDIVFTEDSLRMADGRITCQNARTGPAPRSAAARA